MRKLSCSLAGRELICANPRWASKVSLLVVFCLIVNSPLFVTAIVDDERLSAEQMDERRRQNIAYEYLCHLEEAKQ